MKYRLINIIFTCSISICLLFFGCSKSDPFPKISLPIHPSAINPESFFDRPAKGAKCVVYDLRMPFPADEITIFYDSEMDKMGFKPSFEKEAGTFKWENYNYKSGEWEVTTTVPARYTATWVNPEKTLRIWLYIAYKYDGADNSWKNTPMVSCNMANYFDFSLIDPPNLK